MEVAGAMPPFRSRARAKARVRRQDRASSRARLLAPTLRIGVIAGTMANLELRDAEPGTVTTVTWMRWNASPGF